MILMFSLVKQAKKVLKGLRIVASPSNRESKITGLSDMACAEQTYATLSSGFYLLLKPDH